MTTAEPPPPRSWPSTRSCPATRAGGISNPVLGMLLFITSEVMFFAGLFAAYFAIRAGYTEFVGVGSCTSGRRPSSRTCSSRCR